MFDIGDKVIHPGCGACRVKGIRRGPKGAIFVLKPVRKMPGGLEILVAEYNVERAGVHYPIQKKEIEKILDILRSDPNDISGDSENAYETVRKNIKLGDPYTIAESVRDLAHSEDERFLSVKEKFVQTAKDRLAEEISYVNGFSKEDGYNLIERTMKNN
ncbi:MAG: hypothetical protein ABIJ27_04120 [Candidatus Omnitrophota bacterium]